MWLVNFALRRPYTILVLTLAMALTALLAVRRMKVDVFPHLNLPIIYVAQPYGGMDPAQMEGYIVNYYEFHFLYIPGIEHVESRSIQNVGLIKLVFQPGTNMSQAMAQTVSYVARAHSFMPRGTVPPFVIRFDAGSVPVGDLVFSSPKRSVSQLQDLALFRVRPVFATLPGVSAPPPFGGNQRTIVIRVHPRQLRAYDLSPRAVVRAIISGNVIAPAGNIRIGKFDRMVHLDGSIHPIARLLDLPIRTGTGATVYLRDVGSVLDTADIRSGYAEVNGRRTVYIPMTKRAGASTLSVVNEIKAALPKMRAQVPRDVHIRFEFDQSVYVRRTLDSLILEALLGAGITGLVVWFFLRDGRSAGIVVLTIPLALLGAVVGLWLAGQTLNIMTLGGLALAVGVLVDEATVMVENIHTHLEAGQPVAPATLAASREVIVPRLLAMLSVLAVFLPSFFMTGIARTLFVPLSLAVGFAMVASFLLSSSLVPVVSIWSLRHKPSGKEGAGIGRWRMRLRGIVQHMLRRRVAWLLAYLGACTLLIAVLAPAVGTDIFPSSSAHQFLLRLRAPTGTRVKQTERIYLRTLHLIQRTAGPGNVRATVGFVGTQPTTYPINTIYLWTSGPQEAVMQVALRSGSGIRLSNFEQRLRGIFRRRLPNVQTSFESGDIISQILNFGSPTPVQIAVQGLNLAADRAYARKIRRALARIPSLRDLQFGQPYRYPDVEVRVNRNRAGQLGLTMAQISHALTDGTESSRFIAPDFWRDPRTGVGYQVQVELPQSRMHSLNDLRDLPVRQGQDGNPVLLSNIARIHYGTMVAEYDRYNMQRMVTLTANLYHSDLGHAASAIERALRRLPPPARGMSVAVRGQIAPLYQTLRGLGTGLLLTVLIIFLLFAANFQSWRLAWVSVAAAPAVIAGVLVTLWMTGTTLNIESFMGAIMAVGVSVANGLLLVTMAETRRRDKGRELVSNSSGSELGRQRERIATEAALEGLSLRLRPILMTAGAMIAGMLPLALGGRQSAPLGQAVIGGLLASTVMTLVILPLVYSWAQRHASTGSASLYPEELT